MIELILAFTWEVNLLPNTASAKKKARQIKTKTVRNNILKSQMRYSIKKFVEALSTSDPDKINSALVNALKTIDIVSAKGVIHKNTAARKKSSLYKMLSNSETSAS
jgi:small subunit ribosomal protein S20